MPALRSASRPLKTPIKTLAPPPPDSRATTMLDTPPPHPPSAAKPSPTPLPRRRSLRLASASPITAAATNRASRASDPAHAETRSDASPIGAIGSSRVSGPVDSPRNDAGSRAQLSCCKGWRSAANHPARVSEPDDSSCNDALQASDASPDLSLPSSIKGSGKWRRSISDHASRVSQPVDSSRNDGETRASVPGKRKEIATSGTDSTPDDAEASAVALTQRRRSLRLTPVRNLSFLPAEERGDEVAGDAGAGLGVSEMEFTCYGVGEVPASDASPEAGTESRDIGMQSESNVKSYNYEEKGKGKLDLEMEPVGNGSNAMVIDLTGEDEEPLPTSGRRFSTQEKGKNKLDLELGFNNEVVVDLTGDDGGMMNSRIRFSAEEKGKSKLVIEKDWLSLGRNEVELDEDRLLAEEVARIWEMDELEMNIEDISVKGKKSERAVGLDTPDDDQILAEEVAGSSKRRKSGKKKGRSDSRREMDRSKALELAPKFAFFKPDDDDEEGEEPAEGLDVDGEEDWPGPFSTAMKIIGERKAMIEAREAGVASKKVEASKITWTPTTERRPRLRVPPSLRDLCLKTLVENVEEVESLEGVPDSLKLMLVRLLCRSKRMSVHALGLMVSGSPTKIQLTDGTWATDEQMEVALALCNNEMLQAVQLDMCGRCMTDYVLHRTLARSPNCLPSLTTLSLMGAYRLTDDGLNTIVSSAPLLSSVNLSQCSLLTSHGIMSLANKLNAVLRELYIDDCQNLDAMLILPALKKLQLLEVFSVAHIQTVSDKFVRQLISFSGPNLKTLGFAGCCKLGPASMKTIGETCSHLCSLDLRYLNKLNDCAIGYIANGCRKLEKLKLRRNGFSDEAIAAFVEASGEALTELSLNNVLKVGELTAIAISRRCSNLRNLDLSFCRAMSDEALGLIADSCPNLRVLKLFGCTQVTDLFLEGHSNGKVKVIGLKEPILQDMEISDSL